jgi:hypothetical protein
MQKHRKDQVDPASVEAAMRRAHELRSEALHDGLKFLYARLRPGRGAAKRRAPDAKALRAEPC